MALSTVSSWQQILRLNFTNWEKLATFLELDENQKTHILKSTRFILNLPMRLAEKIEKKTLKDPVLKQFLPLKEELVETPGFVLDPVGDCAVRKSSKLLHKYQGRVLLVCTSSCAMHCRYCFRQNFNYDVKDKTFEKEIAAIKSDSSIKEVILSGGDPLSLPERILEPLLLQLNTIHHVKRIRFHSRFPIGIPERIDGQFHDLIQRLDKQIWFILHCNHPNELDEDIFSRVKELQKQRVVLGNQAVLLKDVNNDVDTLQELSEMLVDNGILPYYLHQLDRVQGACHFEVSEEEGLKLIDQLRCRLPGYGVPKYVREISGEPSKTPISLHH